MNPQLSANDPENGVISTINRRYIEKVTGVTQDNQSRYYKKFKKKGLLVPGKVDKQWVVNPILIPDIIKDRVQLILVLKINEES